PDPIWLWFGMSKLGASPFATDVCTASANLLSGWSQEPRYAAMAQWIGSVLTGGTVLQRSTSWAICRAAIEMFRHGVNIATVAVVGWPPRPVSPRRIRMAPGSV